MPRALLRFLLILAPTAAFGCGTEPSADANPAASKAGAPAAPGAFRPSECGTLRGLVTWTDPVPDVAPVLRFALRADGLGYVATPVPLANAPHIDPATRGLAGAVVFLRAIDPDRARPWDLGAVVVEFRDGNLIVNQDGRTGRTGFVRPGQKVTMRSAEPTIQVLRGRGAAFFAVPFPDPDSPRERAFESCGRIELTSASGSYWQAADLFVCDHPYYAVTDGAGAYHFPLVPAGTYDLVAWHPNWVVARTDRNPESCIPGRLHYAAPLERSRPAAVSAGRTTLANLTLP